MITYILLGVVALIGVTIFLRSSSASNGGYNDVSVADLDMLTTDKNTVLVDVRTAKEMSQGVIGKPLKIELGTAMQQKFSALDKNKKYIIYCRSGRRSVLASKVMSKMGFKDVNNLLGGYLAWEASN